MSANVQLGLNLWQNVSLYPLESISSKEIRKFLRYFLNTRSDVDVALLIGFPAFSEMTRSIYKNILSETIYIY